MSLVIEGSCNEGRDLRGEDFSERESFGDLEDMSELGMFNFQCKSTMFGNLVEVE
jgi:hypothetical protein